MLIAKHLSDESCASILSRIKGRLLEDEFTALCNSAYWEESEHPRASDGRFARKGSGAPSHMTKKEEAAWVKTGRVSPKAFAKERKEITKLKERVQWLELRGSDAGHVKSKLVDAQRDLSEKIRSAKHEKRVSLEGKATRRHMKKLAREYYDIDSEIDYLHEVYGDRDGDGTALKFPETKKAAKDKAKLQELEKRWDELRNEIDWDLVEDENED